MSDYISLEEIENIRSVDEFRSTFWGFKSRKVARKNHLLVVELAVEYKSFDPLNNMAKGNTLSSEALDEIVKHPELVVSPVMQGGFGDVFAQLSDSQLFKMLDGLAGESSTIWTSFYQKTLIHNAFRKNSKKMQTILHYLIFDKKIHKISQPQIIGNIIELMPDLSKEFIYWLINDYGNNVISIVDRLLSRQGLFLSIDVLEYIYFEMGGTSWIASSVANIMLERDPDNVVLGDMFEKTKNEKYIPSTMKDVFVF